MAGIALRSARASVASLAPRLVPGVLCDGPLQSFCTSSTEETQDTKEKERNIPKAINFSPGIYKAILIGQVGQPPSIRTLGNGTEVVNFALGTGGLRNNRKALEGESTEAYAERSFTQWHRICVFKPSLVGIAKQLKKGINVYVEGNIETRVYNDPVTGAPKRVREISVRQNGRLYMMGAKPLLENET